MQRSIFTISICATLALACDSNTSVTPPYVATGGLATDGMGIMGTGGVVNATGGIASPTGGVVDATGGIASPTGGMDVGTGGMDVGTGGMDVGTGGMDVGTGGMDVGTGGMDVGTGGMAEAYMRPCISQGSEVVVIGDSYCEYFPAHRPLVDFLQERARPADALGALDFYKDYSRAGMTLASGNAAIQKQWHDNKSRTPIHVVVMTGGGNDVLIDNPDCRPEGSETKTKCQQIVMNSLDAAQSLWADMKANGVSDVLYFWYPHIPGGAFTGGERGISMSDYTYPMLESAAASASTDTFHVYMIPTVAIFEGHPEYFASDGLHANNVGEGKIADAIWGKMTDECIGQGESSGCCATTP